LLRALLEHGLEASESLRELSGENETMRVKMSISLPWSWLLFAAGVKIPFGISCTRDSSRNRASENTCSSDGGVVGLKNEAKLRNPQPRTQSIQEPNIREQLRIREQQGVYTDNRAAATHKRTFLCSPPSLTPSRSSSDMTGGRLPPEELAKELRQYVRGEMCGNTTMAE
jgi:hypothetical protein